MGRIKSPLCNRLTTTTQDNLIIVSMNGPEMDAWDPVPAALAWKAMENRKIKLLQPVPSLEMLADDSDSELIDQ